MGVRGYVSAYDAATGKMVWRFYTVPGNPADGFETPELERAAKTWSGEWWKYGGGGTVWDSMAYDPELDLLYIGVGNGSPWNHRIRSNGAGDNLFLSSVVALRPDTGQYVWHFQSTPAESWDYTATQHIILADLPIERRHAQGADAGAEERLLLCHRSRDRRIHPREELRQRDVDDRARSENGRPDDVPEARYLREPAMVAPGPLGAHNWYPMSFSELTRLVYIPALESASYYKHDDKFQFRERTWNTGVSMIRGEANPRTVEAAAKSNGRRLPAGVGSGCTARSLACALRARRQRRHAVDRRQSGVSGIGGRLFQRLRREHRRASVVVQRAERDSRRPDHLELDGEQYVAALAGIGGVAIGGGLGGGGEA